MKKDAVREAVLISKQSPVDLYRSSSAVDYSPKKR
jgi:hypothetical protein